MVAGVSPDLIVRPFQWKGIASNERNFVKDACQSTWHAAREKNPGFNTSSEDHDGDVDGHLDELSIGDVSALSIFTMTIRPPTQVKPIRLIQQAEVERGRKIFSGQLLVTVEKSCSSCHKTSLKLESPIVVVRDPRAEAAEFGPVAYEGNGIGLSAQRKSSTQLPDFRRFLELKPGSTLQNLGGDKALFDALKKSTSDYDKSFLSRVRKDGYAFDLELQPADDSEIPEPMSESLPRLVANADGAIDVPLFSDLRRHKIGKLLSERKGFLQATDVAPPQIPGVPEDEFLTRPLWGVGDTGPWLHDGRGTIAHRRDHVPQIGRQRSQRRYRRVQQLARGQPKGPSPVLACCPCDCRSTALWL